MGMMDWGNRAVGRKALVFMLALVVGLAVVGPASADVVQNSPGQNQYGGEQPVATTPPTPEVASPEVASPAAEPDVFLPPTVASAGQEDTDSGILPFTGAALALPSVLGGLLLAGGLLLVYRTRRREN
jgi:LPXTG-motif cell wall-anchored protein